MNDSGDKRVYIPCKVGREGNGGNCMWVYEWGDLWGLGGVKSHW